MVCGELIIFHAGSLEIPFSRMEKEFNALYPEITIQRRSGGSTKLAQIIAESKRPADIMASADYQVIEDVLLPEKALWNILFATNRLVLCYTAKSRYAGQITSANWFDILLRPGVKWGHSDPLLDPCGYRTLMLFQLAQLHYKMPGLYEQLMQSRRMEYVKPKSIELVDMLKAGELDYGWEYISVAVQHGLKYVDLPDQINLGNPDFDTFYSKAKVDFSKSGTNQGSRRGKACVYGVTIMKDAPNSEAATAFLDYFLNPKGGLKILEEEGQPPIVPCRASYPDMMDLIPDEISCWLQ